MVNVTTLAIGGNTNVGYGSGKLSIVRHEIDIAAAVSAGLATTEYVVAVRVPANTLFDLYQAEVVTTLSLGSGARIDIGDAGSATRYVNNATTLTAGTDLTLASTRLHYTAAGEIRITVTGATLASGRLRLVFGLIDTSRVASGVSPAL